MVKKDQLIESMSRRFQEICNYQAKYGLTETTLLNTPELGEEDTSSEDKADEEEPIDTNTGNGGAEQMDNNVGQMNGDDSMPMNGGAAPMASEELSGNVPNSAPTPEGLAPQEEPDVDFEGDVEQPGDEVLDVTDLTDKQEEMDKEIGAVGKKFDNVLKALGEFANLIKSNDDKIEALKAEFEKRNPTQIEKLNMQTAKSYPFNVKPSDYWSEKEQTSNYSTDSDNNGKGEKQYTITTNDIMGGEDWKSISDSLDDEDFMYHQTLDKILKM